MAAAGIWRLSEGLSSRQTVNTPFTQVSAHLLSVWVVCLTFKTVPWKVTLRRISSCRLSNLHFQLCEMQILCSASSFNALFSVGTRGEQVQGRARTDCSLVSTTKLLQQFDPEAHFLQSQFIITSSTFHYKREKSCRLWFNPAPIRCTWVPSFPLYIKSLCSQLFHFHSFLFLQTGFDSYPPSGTVDPPLYINCCVSSSSSLTFSKFLSSLRRVHQGHISASPVGDL